MHFNKIMFVKVKCESCCRRRYRLSFENTKYRSLVLYALQSGISAAWRSISISKWQVLNWKIFVYKSKCCCCFCCCFLRPFQASKWMHAKQNFCLKYHIWMQWLVVCSAISVAESIRSSERSSQRTSSASSATRRYSGVWYLNDWKCYFFILLCFIVEMRIFTFWFRANASYPSATCSVYTPMIEHNRNESYETIFVDLPLYFQFLRQNFTKKICGNSVIALCIFSGADAAAADDDDVIVDAAASTHQTLLLIDGFLLLLLLLFISSKMSSDTLCCYFLRSLCYRFSNKTLFFFIIVYFHLEKFNDFQGKFQMPGCTNQSTATLCMQ